MVESRILWFGKIGVDELYFSTLDEGAKRNFMERVTRTNLDEIKGKPAWFVAAVVRAWGLPVDQADRIMSDALDAKK
jgi:hypothetical protein